MLGWEPRVDFKGLVEMMVDANIERVSGQVKKTPAGGLGAVTIRYSGSTHFTGYRPEASLPR